jgi:hypothetical protein
MSYVLATTESTVHWYAFAVGSNTKTGSFELLEVLDLKQVPRFPDKAAAKQAALALGLNTWRYVKI